MSDKRDYYEILGIAKNSTPEEIRKAYRKLAVRWHPDKNPDNKVESDAKFKEISEAYEVLSNEENRNKYDKFGHEGLRNDGYNGPTSDFMEDIFKHMFGGMGGGMGSGMRGDDDDDDVPPIQIQENCTLEELYVGKKIKKKIERHNPCAKCNGTGNEDGIEHPCKKCNGQGVTVKVIQMGPMMFQQSHEKCKSCNGTGRDMSVKKCSKCKGTRINKEEVEITCEIPKGAYMKHHIIIENMGNEIPVNERRNGKTRSDVIVFVNEITHDKFKRMFIIKGKKDYPDPADLLLEIDIDLADSLCGLQKKIKHIDGSEFTINHESIIKHGDVFVIENKGMPKMDLPGKYGDLYVSIKINYPDEIPKNIQTRLYQLLTNKPYKIKENDQNTLNMVHINKVNKNKNNSKFDNSGYSGFRGFSGQNPQQGFNFKSFFG